LEKIMKSFQLKALSLAVLGLAAIGMTGSAFAATCPSVDSTSHAGGGGGAWSSQTVTAMTFTMASPGLNGTNCALSVSMNSGAASNTKGFVTDTSPNNESHYRARFYVNTAGLTNMTVANRQFRVFSALATTAPSGAGAEMVFVNFIGGATPSFRFSIGDTANGGITIASVAVPNLAGNYRVEFDLQQGAPGSFRYWVTDAATATSDGSPTGTATPTNSGWSGVKQVNLGIFGTSTNFRANVATQPLIVDEFDSRRATFIGL
jgi:hypothetical protein